MKSQNATPTATAHNTPGIPKGRGLAQFFGTRNTEPTKQRDAENLCLTPSNCEPAPQFWIRLRRTRATLARAQRNNRMILKTILTLLTLACVTSISQAKPTLAVIVGAPGTTEYGVQFREWADRWQTAATESDCEHVEFGLGSKAATTRDSIKSFLETVEPATDPLWLVFIGHGTHFREKSNLNLQGPDLSATDLNEWLVTVKRPIVLINCASSSGPFIKKLAAENRIVITTTKSGAEHNFARFGDFLSRSINDATADLDHDDRVSLLEAFLSASSRVAQFYEQENRLATEHALIDDNGDGLGTPPKFYRGVRPTQAPKADKKGNVAKVDGRAAGRIGLKPSAGQDRFTEAQKAELSKLEQQVESLRAKKLQLGDDAYYHQLQPLMVRLAKLYRAPERTVMNIDEVRGWLESHTDDIFRIVEFEPRRGEIKKGWFTSWFGGSAFDDRDYRFRVIGKDGTGGVFAEWVRKDADEPHPLVFLGSEGGYGVVAKSSTDWLLMLAHAVGVEEYGPDSGPTRVDPAVNYYFEPDYDELEESKAALERYRKATIEKFGDLPSFESLAANREDLNKEFRAWVAESIQ